MTGGPVNLTATGQVKVGGGAIDGFYVNSTTAGTVQLYDNASTAANAVGGVITPAIGWNPYPLRFVAGLRAVIGGTLDVTFVVSR